MTSASCPVDSNFQTISAIAGIISLLLSIIESLGTLIYILIASVTEKGKRQSRRRAGSLYLPDPHRITTQLGNIKQFIFWLAITNGLGAVFIFGTSIISILNEC